MQAGRGQLKRAMRCIMAGAEALKQEEKTVSFAKAVEAAREARKMRRARTQSDFKYITSRFLKRCAGLSKRKIRSISTEQCREYIETAFTTPSQRIKARSVLSGVFSTAQKRGWCSSNPVIHLEKETVTEQRIRILNTKEIEGLLTTAAKYEGGKCLAAVGLMLYAGIRPHEVARLNWEEIDMANKSICILPQHSKTGGARQLTIQPPLLRLLADCTMQSGRICPPQWLFHWRKLRKQAGFTAWQQDILRHTFASYHLHRFRNYTELQYEIGHRDSSLLRTRYVDMRGVEDSAAFWS